MPDRGHHHRDHEAVSERDVDVPCAGAGRHDQDGAGADEEDTPGIRSIAYAVDHARKDAIIVPAGGTRQRVELVLGPDGPELSADRYFRMDGPAVREYAVPALEEAVRLACRDAGIVPEELALLGDGCSVQSPLGRALLGASVGETREVVAPRGAEELEVTGLEGEAAADS